jgi:hypothetical protein
MCGWARERRRRGAGHGRTRAGLTNVDDARAVSELANTDFRRDMVGVGLDAIG